MTALPTIGGTGPRRLSTNVTLTPRRRAASVTSASSSLITFRATSASRRPASSSLASVLSPGGRSDFGWTGLVIAVFGPAVFLLLAVIVTRRLRAIARRQDLSHHQEIVAAEESAGWYAARVQRSLWVADLIETASTTLTKIAAADRDIPVELKTEARLLEAGMREALVARNVMSDELADVTDAARRRGVSVTFVDSRRGPVPPIVGRAVTTEVRAALESSAVQKVVVRLGPGPHQATSVVYQDGARTRLTTIDETGNWRSEEIESSG